MKKIMNFIFLIATVSFLAVGCKEKLEESPKIVFIKGNVYLDDLELKQGSEVENGKEFRMDENSYVDVRFPDSSIVRLKGAKAKLDWKPGETEWNLTSGIIFSSVSKKKKSDQYRIVTPTSVMGVRGTRFYAEELTDKSYLCVCHGSVAASFKDSSGKGEVDERIVNAGQDLYLKSGEKLGDPIESPDMKAMADAVFKEMGVDID
ncbi:MAG: FecR domain-containing protein [Leptospira sp.]|nr:FecR domain-containing protein [Leptospira sp.]